jgi:hypothetical protein
MLSATAVLALMSSASDTHLYDSIWKEAVAVLSGGVVLGGIYGLFLGLLPGGVCGLIFEAGVTKYWLKS